MKLIFLYTEKVRRKKKLLNKAINPFGKDHRIDSSSFFNVSARSEGIFLNLYKLSANLDISISRYLTSKQQYEAVMLRCEVLQLLVPLLKKTALEVSPP